MYCFTWFGNVSNKPINYYVRSYKRALELQKRLIKLETSEQTKREGGIFISCEIIPIIFYDMTPLEEIRYELNEFNRKKVKEIRYIRENFEKEKYDIFNFINHVIDKKFKTTIKWNQRKITRNENKRRIEFWSNVTIGEYSILKTVHKKAILENAIFDFNKRLNFQIEYAIGALL